MDSRAETWRHINDVQILLNKVIAEIQYRALVHDQSKLVSPEVEYFDEFTEKLKSTTYGSEEYKKNLESIKPALTHHYAKNRHHPQHFKNGVADMNLVDLIEMLCDWLAATKRHDDGNINFSIDKNEQRFEYPAFLSGIFRNTLPLLQE